MRLRVREREETKKKKEATHPPTHPYLIDRRSKEGEERQAPILNSSRQPIGFPYPILRHCKGD